MLMHLWIFHNWAVAPPASEFRSHQPPRIDNDRSCLHLSSEKFGVKIPFPIIEDIKMEVAHAYGMVHSGAADTQAVRAAFFIDPNGVLRAMVYYPMSNGRSISEFVRLLQAMQTSDKNAVATPEGWTPGCDVIVPPPKIADTAARDVGENRRGLAAAGGRRGLRGGLLVAVNSLAFPVYFGDTLPWQLGAATVLPSLMGHIIYGASIGQTSRRFVATEKGKDIVSMTRRTVLMELAR
jgi:hypothetical protein